MLTFDTIEVIVVFVHFQIAGESNCFFKFSRYCGHIPGAIAGYTYGSQMRKPYSPMVSKLLRKFVPAGSSHDGFQRIAALSLIFSTLHRYKYHAMTACLFTSETLEI